MGTAIEDSSKLEKKALLCVAIILVAATLLTGIAISSHSIRSRPLIVLFIVLIATQCMLLIAMRLRRISRYYMWWIVGAAPVFAIVCGNLGNVRAYRFELLSRAHLEAVGRKVDVSDGGLVTVNGWVGEYPVIHARRLADEGVFFLLGSPGKPRETGLAWFRQSRLPFESPWWDSELQLTPLIDGWFEWRIAPAAARNLNPPLSK